MEYQQVIVGLLNYLGLTKEVVVPFLIFGLIFYGLIAKRIGIGEKKLKKVLKSLQKAVQSLNHAVIEIQDFLKYKSDAKFEHKIESFAIDISPMVLKKEFEPLITTPGLGKQIEKQMPKLISWLKKENPKTGLDAQTLINYLVNSNKIKEFVDLTAYKQYVYERGRTLSDADAILVLYLYGVLIPKVIKTEKSLVKAAKRRLKKANRES